VKMERRARWPNNMYGNKAQANTPLIEYGRCHIAGYVTATAESKDTP
jgi:hypothetical protein